MSPSSSASGNRDQILRLSDAGNCSSENSAPRIVSPGESLGMLGGGQLGRMFALAARRSGYHVQIFGDHSSSPAGQVADRSWPAALTEESQLRQFAEHVSVVSLETENIPVRTVEFLEQFVPVYPSRELLRASQHRLLEKTMLRSIGIPTADFFSVKGIEDLQNGLLQFGGTGILKTVTEGYDGKGQVRIASLNGGEAAWSSLKTEEAILEREISFDCEVSVVAGRFADGRVVSFRPTVNHHVNHILDVSVTPSSLLDPATEKQASEIAAAILEHFGTYGVLCVEFFLTKSGQLLVNEIAPRPHNSGHLTIEACRSSQFEQQFRAISGMPSGDVSQVCPAAMINLLGDHLMNATPERWQSVFAMPNVFVHLYGKAEARRGRKMGHLTVLAETSERAEATARKARAILMGEQAR